MLDPGLEESPRDQLATDARGQIEGGGTLKHENAWGLRKMAYEIRQRTEADYRWFRFEAPRELLGQLDHNLKIADGVLRFRIFQVDPDSPGPGPPPTCPRAGRARTPATRSLRSAQRAPLRPPPPRRGGSAAAPPRREAPPRRRRPSPNRPR